MNAERTLTENLIFYLYLLIKIVSFCLFLQGTEKTEKPKKKLKKSLVEKKIAILDKSLESNSESLELHTLRLELLNSISRPKFVLTEWKKLALSHQNESAFWTEYLRFASSQIQLYSVSTITAEFDTTLEKFRAMIQSEVGKKPKNFTFLVADVMFAFTVLLKNSGYLEKAFAIHQGQIEQDFGPGDEGNRFLIALKWS